MASHNIQGVGYFKQSFMRIQQYIGGGQKGQKGIIYIRISDVLYFRGVVHLTQQILGEEVLLMGQMFWERLFQPATHTHVYMHTHIQPHTHTHTSILTGLSNM